MAYGYLVQFRPYKGAKKRKQIVSSTKWEIAENVALWLMEHLTPTFTFDIFMDNYFVCLPTSELTTFEQQVC